MLILIVPAALLLAGGRFSLIINSFAWPPHAPHFVRPLQRRGGWPVVALPVMLVHDTAPSRWQHPKPGRRPLDSALFLLDTPCEFLAIWGKPMSQLRDLALLDRHSEISFPIPRLNENRRAYPYGKSSVLAENRSRHLANSHWATTWRIFPCRSRRPTHKPNCGVLDRLAALCHEAAIAEPLRRSASSVPGSKCALSSRWHCRLR